MLTQFAADWFHPNDRGYRVWAETFWVEIARLWHLGAAAHDAVVSRS